MCEERKGKQNKMLYRKSAKERRIKRIRAGVKQAADGKPRLSVFRSGRYIYGQIIDDVRHHTLVFGSSIEKEIQAKIASKNKNSKEAAVYVGEQIAQRALEKGIASVVFDRGPYAFHGRVKALADAAREKGLKF